MPFDPTALLVPGTGLLGALMGAKVATRAAKINRRQARRSEQLNKFYAPLLGMRQQILAKSLVRVAVHHATNAAWQDLVTPFHGNPEALAKVTEKREEFDRAIEYENEQHRDELMPLYRKMVAHFSENLGYAEPETRAYYPALVSFVEIWERWMKKALPTEALAHLDHGEDTLKPFYAHLEDQVTRLQDQLVERFPLLHPIRRWLRGRLTGQAEQAPDDGTRRLAPSRSLKPMG